MRKLGYKEVKWNERTQHFVAEPGFNSRSLVPEASALFETVVYDVHLESESHTYPGSSPGFSTYSLPVFTHTHTHPCWLKKKKKFGLKVYLLQASWIEKAKHILATRLSFYIAHLQNKRNPTQLLGFPLFSDLQVLAGQKLSEWLCFHSVWLDSMPKNLRDFRLEWWWQGNRTFLESCKWTFAPLIMGQTQRSSGLSSFTSRLRGRALLCCSARFYVRVPSMA